MLDNGVYELVVPPKGCTIISNKWVFRVKTKADGTLDKQKARLVALGYRMKAGLDYTKLFAPIVRFVTLRVFMAMVAAENLEMHEMDVSNAFLNGAMDEEMFMIQRDGFIKEGEEGLV